MGQILVVNIKSGDKILASSYYHWSGYTGSTLEICNNLVNIYYDLKHKITDKKLLAIRMLLEENPGASLYSLYHNRDAFMEMYPNADKELYKLNAESNRNVGMVLVTDKLIAETFGEEVLTLNLDTETLWFDAFCETPIEYVKEDYDLDAEELIQKDFIAFKNLDEISSCKFEDLDTLLQIWSRDDFIACTKNETLYVSAIA